MLFLAHRGNAFKRIPTRENEPSYLQEALNYGFGVEIDVWFDNGWWTGHDEPKYKFSDISRWFDNPKCLFHAKNLEALKQFDGIEYLTNVHYFWHDKDDYTITSGGIIVIHAGKPLVSGGICMLPEQYIEPIEKSNLKKCYAICSDMISSYHFVMNE